MTDAVKDIAYPRNRIDLKYVAIIHKNQLHFFKPVQTAFAKGTLRKYQEVKFE